MASLLNSKLKFLQGSQVDLDKLLTETSAIKKENKGSFYLTNDTHRLYIQESDNSIVPVNEGVLTVDDVDSLPTVTADNKKAYVGRFYYVTKENILCVYSGQGWVQINANTNTVLDSKLPAVEVSDVSDNGTIITTTIRDTDKNTATGNFTIKDSTEVNKIVVNDNTIDIQGEVYNLGSSVLDNTATVKITPTNNPDKDSQISIAAGDNVEIIANGENGIKINSSYSNTVNSKLVATYDGFTGGDGTLTITLTDSDENSVTDKVSLGKYYTEAEIDEKFKNLNGLKYIGTISSTDDIPSSDDNIESGYMYLISAEEVKFNESLTAHKGDIVIATGTENTSGYLTTITWTYIPSGDDEEIDTTYHLSGLGLTHGVKLYNENGTTAEGSFALKAGDAIDLADSVTAEDESVINQVVTVKHSDVSHTTTPKDSEETTDATSITYVDDITVNKQGHVTNVSTHKAELRDTTYELSGATVKKDVNSNKVTITDTLTNKRDESKAGTSSVSLISETLTLSASTDNTVAADITWGSF